MKLLKITIVIISGLIACNAVIAEGTWKAYLDSNQIYDMAVEDQYVWWATSHGGVVKWNIRDGTYRKFTTLDGLN